MNSAKNMQILSLQIDPPLVRAVLLDKKKGRVEIRALKSAPLLDPQNVKALYMPSWKGKIVTGLSAKEVFVRPVELPIGKSRYLEEALSFQSEASSYFSPGEVLDVPYLLRKEKEKTEALIFTVSRQALKNHLQELAKLDLDPDQVGAWPLSLIRYTQWKIPSLTDAFLIDLGSSEWTCVWMEKGTLKKSHSLAGGVEALLVALWEDRKKSLLPKELEGVAKQIDLLQFKPDFNPVFSQKLQEMRRELAKILFSFHRTAKELPVLFTGRIDPFLNLRPFLLEGFREAISGEYNHKFPLEELKYAICLGTALEPSLQFRRKEFFPPRHWRQMGRLALSLTALSLSLSALLLFGGEKMIQARKAVLSRSLQTALHEWDPKLRREIFARASSPEEILARWSPALAGYHKDYPYLPQVPKVAEVLSWISHHPLFDPSGENALSLQEMRYQLLQFPRIESLETPFQAKVELTFQAKNPMAARKFHELLLQGDAWVDPNEEISWEVLQEGYKTSFSLKKREPYVL